MRKAKSVSIKRKLLYEIIAAVVCIAILFTISAYAGYVLMPDRQSFGALWNMFKNEDEDSIDILITGSSIAYCDIIPSVIYEKTGRTSYVLAGPEMTFPISYYYLKEAFKLQSPSVVMLEATGIFFKRYEGYSKVNIGYLPYDLNRIMATFFAAEKEERLGLLFPLYNYHSQLETIELNTLFTKRADDKLDIAAGYTYITGATPQPERKPREQKFLSEDFKYNCKYLQKIMELCEDNGAELILLFAPSAKYPSDELMKEFNKVAEDMIVIDYNERSAFERIGIDLQSDYFDSLHFNVKGARKFSSVLADYLSENFTFETRAYNRDLWQCRINYEKSLAEEE